MLYHIFRLIYLLHNKNTIRFPYKKLISNFSISYFLTFSISYFLNFLLSQFLTFSISYFLNFSISNFLNF